MTPLRTHLARALSAGCAALFLVAQLAAFAHLVRVRHITCDEHGELVEVGVRSEASRPRDDASPSLQVADGAFPSHGHDHCLLAPRERSRASSGGGGTARVVPPARSIDRTFADRGAAHCPVALLLLAPKSSPPA